MRRLLLLLLLCLLILPGLLGAQVLPPATGGGSPPPQLPGNACVDEVGIGITTGGLLQCGPVLPAMVQGLVPSGGDVDSTGQVTATHLSVPLPVAQGGTGLAGGTRSGLLYFSSPTTLGSSGPLPLDAPLFGGGPGQAPVAGTISGTTRQLASVLGDHTPQKQLTFDANGNIIASAFDVGGSGAFTIPLPVPQGGTGLVSGTAGGILYFATDTTLAPTAVLPLDAPLFGGGPGQAPLTGTRSGTTLAVATVTGSLTPQKQLAFDASGNVIASTVDIGSSGLVFPVPVPQGGTGLTSGTPGSLLYFATATTLAETGALPAQAPLFGGGAGQPPMVGTRSGTTLEVATVTGTHTPQKQLTFDPNGNIVASVVDIGGSSLPLPLPVPEGGTGIVSGNPGGILYFSTATTMAATPTLGLNAPLFGGGAGQPPIVGTRSGNTLEVATSTGPHTPLKQLAFDSNGNIVASTADIGGAALTIPVPVPQGGTGLTAGTAGGLLYFATPTTLATSPALTLQAPLVGGGPGQPPLTGTRSGTTVAFATVTGTLTPQKQLAFDPSGNVVASTVDIGSSGLTLPVPVPQGGTGLASGIPGGVLYFTSAVTMSTTGALPEGSPLFGGGPGQGPTAGTRSGTTLEVATVTGAHTPQKQLTFDPNGNIIASPADIAGGGGTVLSVFGRIGVVTSQAGDYSATQVTNAADVTQANVFAHPSGQTMPVLTLTGSLSGSLALRAAPIGGTSLIIFPAGSSDFSATGGANQVVRQSSTGGPFTVGQLALSDLSGTAGICTSAALCPGYQAALGFTPENSANKSTSTALGPSTTLYPSQSAVKSYVDAGLATRQATLGFAPEDVANKSGTATLGTSATLYPTQGAVKNYVDTVAATKQNTMSAGTGIDVTANVISVASAQPGFLHNGQSTSLTCGPGNQGKIQVMASGDIQYCDGAVTAILRTGVLTPNPFHWNITASACLTDTNSGKLTLNASNEIICASDIGGAGGGGGGVTSVFGRTGSVVAQSGDYTAAQVANAADLTLPNIFPHPTGQTMPRLVLSGSTSGSLTLQASAIAGSGTLTFPAGTTNFSGTGGANQVVQQPTAGGPFTVGALSASTLTNGVLGTGAVVLASARGLPSTTPGFLHPGGAVALTCGAGQAGTAQVRSTGELEYCDDATPPVLHRGVPVMPLGTAGTLQASDGALGLAAYGGSSCPVQTPPLVQVGISASGGAICAPFALTLASKVWVSQANTAELTSGVNLGALPAGLIKISVSGGVATPTTVAAPAGAVVGDTDPMRLLNKAVDPRPASFPGNVSPLIFDISTFDYGVISELLQNTLIGNPTGSAVPGQIVRLQVHSTVSRLITWDTQWSGTPVAALPTATTGGATDDVWIFTFNPRIAKFVITFNSQLQIPAPTSGIVAGTYTCPASITFNAQGLATAATSGPCGGGGGSGTPAGADGDLQFNSAGAFGADTGNVRVNPGSHTVSAAHMQVGGTQNYEEFSDLAGHLGTLRAPSFMTNNWLWQFPDEGGQFCVKGGSCFAGLGTGDASTNTATSVDNELALFSGTTGKLLKRATGTGLARVTAGVLSSSELSGDATTSGSNAVTVTRINGTPFAGTSGNLTSFGAANIPADSGIAANQVVTLAGTQTVSNKRNTPRITALSSAATNPTFQCAWDTGEQCRVTATGAAGTLTMSLPSGTPTDGEKLLIRFMCTNLQTITWNAAFIASNNVPKPTQCPANVAAEFHVGVIYLGSLAQFQIIASD
jgi:hypothetical protein